MALLHFSSFEGGAAEFRDRWRGIQRKASDRIRVVTSPSPPEGARAVRFHVERGDTNVAGSGDRGVRAELFGSHRWSGAGSTEFFGWWIRLPNNQWHDNSSWNFHAQLHHSGLTGIVPVWWGITTKREHNASAANPDVVVAARDSSQAGGYRILKLADYSVLRERWVYIQTRIVYRDGNGLIEAWLDGNRLGAISGSRVRTMYQGEGIYLKVGIYQVLQQAPSTWHMDGIRVATTFAESNPATAPPPPPPEPPTPPPPPPPPPPDPEPEPPSDPGPPPPEPGPSGQTVTHNLTDGQVIEGSFSWLADPQPDADVAFLVDGVVVNEERFRPYGDRATSDPAFPGWNDSTRLPDGEHVLRVEAGDAFAESRVIFANEGPPPPPPPPPEPSDPVTLAAEFARLVAIRERINHLREEHGLSQAELQALDTWSDFVGRGGDPRLAELRQLLGL